MLLHHLFVIFCLLIPFSHQNNIGKVCLPERRNFKVYWPCEHEKNGMERLEEQEDRLALFRGAPSAFARTGFYDRLFRQQNLPAVYDDNIPYYPTYGYNPNLPRNGPYRYTNWFVKTERL